MALNESEIDIQIINRALALRTTGIRKEDVDLLKELKLKEMLSNSMFFVSQNIPAIAAGAGILTLMFIMRK